MKSGLGGLRPETTAGPFSVHESQKRSISWPYQWLISNLCTLVGPPRLVVLVSPLLHVGADKVLDVDLAVFLRPHPLVQVRRVRVEAHRDLLDRLLAVVLLRPLLGFRERRYFILARIASAIRSAATNAVTRTMNSMTYCMVFSVLGKTRKRRRRVNATHSILGA